MKPGISPLTLKAQVENTASWALARGPHAEILADAQRVEDSLKDEPNGDAYLRLLLAAHYTTVATFVPTDVDTRIRHHHWQGIGDPERLASACRVVDEVAAFDPRHVSRRVVELDDGTYVSGHAGEWLAVRAGALGRALAIGATDLATDLLAKIDEELAHEGRAMREALRSRDVVRTLRLAITLAHNTGDLSRVVDAWPKSPAAAAVAPSLVRLGHEDRTREGGAFFVAGHLNKALTAIENHRFLALRKPRGLRTSAELLLPLGPWFGAWGAKVATERSLDARDHAEILEALFETHARDPAQTGVLRAIAAMHAHVRGGIDALLPSLPARSRKPSTAIREALKAPEARFDARLENQFRSIGREIGLAL